MDNLNGLSDEQILALLREAEAGTKPTESAPKLRVSLPDGSFLEAADQDEMSKLVQAKLAEAARGRVVEMPKREAPPQNPAAPPSWDMKTFVEKFTEDPDAGLEYMEMAKYGMPIRKVVPQMAALLGAMGQKIQELETNSFAPQDAGEREAVQKVMQERNWQPSRQSFQDALLIAKAQGLVKQPEAKQELPPRNERGQFIPPRVPRTTGGGDSEEQALQDAIRAANTMPLDKLRALLQEAGHLKA